jgi:hypothetical protein
LWVMVVLPCVVDISPVAFMLGRSYWERCSTL